MREKGRGEKVRRGERERGRGEKVRRGREGGRESEGRSMLPLYDLLA